MKYRCKESFELDCYTDEGMLTIGCVEIACGSISPMNTESCRRYIQEKINRKVTQEDVLWLFYHTEKGEK